MVDDEEDLNEGFDEEEERQLEEFFEESKGSKSEPYVPLESSNDMMEHRSEGKPSEAHELKKCVKNAYLVENFAKYLLQIMKQYRTLREIRFNRHFGVNAKDISSVSLEYANFQRNQAIFAHNKFIEQEIKNGNIKEKVTTEYYDDADEVSPTYESIRISRRNHEVCLTVGYQFITWKGTKLVHDLYFSGSCKYVRIHHKNEDREKMKEFVDTFRNFMKEHNLYKGEKLQFSSGGYIAFLEYQKLDWKDVILSPKIREEFELNLLTPLMNGAGCGARGIPWRRGLLLGGLAGTGKTQVCRILCNELEGVTVIWATPKAVQNEDDIAMLFNAARYFSPTLIIIEDIDFIGSSRDFGQDPSLGELLTQLDGNDPNHGIFVIATTNRPEMLDSALANRPSRFDILVEFKLPEQAQREELCKLFSKKMMFDKEPDYKMIAQALSDLTGAQIKEAFVYALLKAMRNVEDASCLVKIDDVITRGRAYKGKNSADAYRE